MLDHSTAFVVSRAPAGRPPAKQQLLLMNQTVQEVLLTVVVVNFEEGHNRDG